MPRVLVVDDDADLRELLHAVLTSAGFAVDRAVDGDEALARMATTRPDLVLLDLMMPGMNGLAFLRAAREQRRDEQVPILVLSAFAHLEPVTEQLHGLGVRAWMSKPFDVSALVGMVAGLAGAP